MALQSSGAISLANVQTEFGGSAPISLSEYYSAAAGVPGSGVISLSDFYGTSAVPAEVDVTFTDTVSPSIFTLSGTLGQAGCDFYVYNDQRSAGIELTSWGINSVGDGYPQWAGSTGNGLTQNTQFWVMIETAAGFGIDPNTWDWFHLTVDSSGQTESWRYSNTSWAPVGGTNLWYLTAGTLFSYSGASGTDFSSVSGDFPSLARHLANYWNGNPSFIDLGANIGLKNGP